MAGSSHFNAICTIKLTYGDKSGSGESVKNLGPGTEFPFVTGVTVVRLFERTGQITLNIDAPFQEGREILNGPLLYTGNTLEVTMRYPDDDRAILVAYGVILKGGIGLTLSPNGISGTITAEGTAQLAKVIKPMVPTKTTSTFEWLTSIALEAGYVELNASERVVKLINETGYSNNEKKPVFELFEDFCSANYLTWIEGAGDQSITILDDEEIDKDKIKRVFVMRNSFIDTGYLDQYGFLQGATLPNPRVYPIISFSPELSAGFFTSREGVKVIRTGIKADGTREVSEKDESDVGSKRTSKSNDGPAGAEDVKAGNNKTVSQLREGEAAEVIPLAHPEADDRRGEDERHKRAVEVRTQAYNASLTSFGIPDVAPSERVAVVGLGDLLDGIFMVKEVTQTWSAGKIETTMSIYSRNAGV